MGLEDTINRVFTSLPHEVRRLRRTRFRVDGLQFPGEDVDVPRVTPSSGPDTDKPLRLLPLYSGPTGDFCVR